MKNNTLIVHIEVGGYEVQDVLDFLDENGVHVNSVSTKELFDQLNYVGRGYKC